MSPHLPKRQLASSLAAVLSLVALTGAALPAQAAAAPAVRSVPAHGAARQPAADRAELQRLLDEVTGSGGATAVLADVRDEAGRWAGVSGVRDLKTSAPVPRDGRFRIGSVTKTFVSTVTLQLTAEGRLRLDDPVERWLPGLVPNGEHITVRNLLQHTSGLYNYTDALPLTGEEFLRIRFRTYRPEELVGVATARPPLFEPGTSWSYSNTNFILAGLIIQKATGHSYSTEIQRRILGPLGLRHTYLPGTSPGIPGPHAHGYLPVERGGQVRLVDVTRINPSWGGSAGDMISTTGDLHRFFSALLAGRMLRPAQQREMLTTVNAPGLGGRYGLGIYEVPLPCGGTVWGHTGGIHGYSTVSFHTPDLRRRLVMSVNPVSDALSEPFNRFLVAVFCGTAAAAPKAGNAAAFTLPGPRLAP